MCFCVLTAFECHAPPLADLTLTPSASPISCVQPKLLVGLAVCHMRQLNYDDALSTLNEALTKNSTYPDTLANLLVVSTQLGKPTTRYQG